MITLIFLAVTMQYETEHPQTANSVELVGTCWLCWKRSHFESVMILAANQQQKRPAISGMKAQYLVRAPSVFITCRMC